MSEIKCPYDLNQFILGEPIFENPFPEEECEKRKYYGDCYHCFSTAIAARDHQLKASVTLQQKWIPVSERLPEADGRYQVTRYDDVTNTEFIDILWYEENLWWNRRFTGDYAVTAWMPLPEPYKAEGSEE